MKRKFLMGTAALALAFAALTGISQSESSEVTQSIPQEVPEDESLDHSAVRQQETESFQSVRLVRYVQAIETAKLISYLEAIEHARWHEEQARIAQKRKEVAARVTTQRSTVTAPSGDVWYRLAMCETGGKMDNPNTGNGYTGYFQFALSTWQSVGGSGYPHHHSYEIQKSYAQKLQARSGWSQWPACSQKLGLR